MDGFGCGCSAHVEARSGRGEEQLLARISSSRLALDKMLSLAFKMGPADLVLDSERPTSGRFIPFYRSGS